MSICDLSILKFNLKNNCTNATVLTKIENRNTENIMKKSLNSTVYFVVRGMVMKSSINLKIKLPLPLSSLAWYKTTAALM